MPLETHAEIQFFVWEMIPGSKGVGTGDGEGKAANVGCILNKILLGNWGSVPLCEHASTDFPPRHEGAGISLHYPPPVIGCCWTREPLGTCSSRTSSKPERALGKETQALVLGAMGSASRGVQSIFK